MAAKGKKQQTLSRRSVLKAVAAGTLSGAGSSLYFHQGAQRLQAERHTLRLARWDADGFRVAVLADLHLNSPEETERAIESIQMALHEKPDLILLPGDFVNYATPDTLANTKHALSFLGEASCPAIATMGNHDYWSRNVEDLIDVIRASPATLLINERFEHRGVTIAGIDDGLHGSDRADFFPEGEVSRSLISVFHEPDFVERMPRHVSLQISGHSHGGQICLPFGIPVHTPLGARRYRTGYYPDAKVPLYVSRGVGTTGPNYRLFCPPEVSILTLRSA